MTGFLRFLFYFVAVLFSWQPFARGGSTDGVLNQVPEGEPKGKKEWKKKGQETLQNVLANQPNLNRAKNVILFVGDGMGLPTVTTARILKGQNANLAGPEQKLSWDTFPNVALAKTYEVNKQVPDSSGTATAFLSGVKTNYGLIGYDENVKFQFCSSEKREHRVPSFLTLGARAGKRAGVVTTTRVTHATPAAAYAHSASRYWERFVGQEDKNLRPGMMFYGEGDVQGACSDIAAQLVENHHGIDVVLGGGRQNFLPLMATDPEYQDLRGKRRDNRHLVREWREKQKTGNKSHVYVWNKAALMNINPKTTDAVLGLFEPSHLQYEEERNKETDPSLSDMVGKAIEILSHNEDGFFLLVEGGRIDHGHHSGEAQPALTEALAMDQAVEKALSMTSKKDTLIVVTADHSHTFMFGGKPSRGNPLFGVDDHQVGNDSFAYTPLVYGNGPGYKKRGNLTLSATGRFRFKQDAAVPLRSETHGGEDVPIYAQGPFAHLFAGVVEQNFVAHAVLYAACIADDAANAETHVALGAHCPKKRGAASSDARSRANNNNNNNNKHPFFLLCLLVLFSFVTDVKTVIQNL